MCVSVKILSKYKLLPYQQVRFPASDSTPPVYILITNQFTMLEYKLTTRTKYN